MFHVERWLGTEGESQKNVSPLSLDSLNAKARERAAALKRGRTGSSSPALPVSDKILDKGDESLRNDGNAEGPTDVVFEEPNGVSVTAPETQHQKRKKKLVEQNVELPGVEAPPDSAEKLPKRKKEKKSHGTGENAVSLEASNSPGWERKTKKVKKSVLDEANGVLGDTANSTSEAARFRNVVERVEVLDSKMEKKKKKKKEKEKPEVGILESADATSHRKDDENESEPLGHGEEEDDEHIVVRSSEDRDASRTLEVSSSEPDFSRIERDVERILGREDLAPAEIQDKRPVLPWMRDPIDIDSYRAVTLAQVPGLDIRLQEALIKTGIKTLFPVQMAVWYETIGPGLCERDVCVSSPTGSGKTLSYALPIVQKLSSRILRLLRALVVLPTRDLAAQVKAVFDTIAPAVGLSVGLAVGQTSITAEAAELVKIRKKMVHSFGKADGSGSDLVESHVDILVATPGRLMDHLRNTRGFTLQHLQFLVVDETDRLLRQAYQDWLPNVLASSSGGSFSPGSVRTIRRCCLERGDRGPGLGRLMKMVLSATLTRDPTKIAQLDLYRPIYVAPDTFGNRYQLPEQLRSFRMVCKRGEKPLYLVALLQQLCGQSTIVFTASVVATHRLYTLLSCFKGFSVKAVEYSSLQHQQARSKALAKFRDGQAQVLIASDAMTRGMDVEGVANVVNYDMPVYAKTYVHRVGRTARAGQAGSAYTLLRREEVRHFKQTLKKVDNSKCKDFFLPSSVTDGLYESYVEALEKLKKIAADEAAASTPHGSRTKDGEQEVTGPDELFM